MEVKKLCLINFRVSKWESALAKGKLARIMVFHLPICAKELQAICLITQTWYLSLLCLLWSHWHRVQSQGITLQEILLEKRNWRANSFKIKRFKLNGPLKRLNSTMDSKKRMNNFWSMKDHPLSLALGIKILLLLLRNSNKSAKGRHSLCPQNVDRKVQIFTFAIFKQLPIHSFVQNMHLKFIVIY
jgi:hypothetical protein